MPTVEKEVQDLGKRLAALFDNQALPSQGTGAGQSTTIHVVNGDVNIFGAPSPVTPIKRPARVKTAGEQT